MDPYYITADELPPIKRNPWADNFFRPLLITIMIMCFNVSLVNLVRVFKPEWRGIFFLLGMLITTIEAIYSHRILTYHRSRHGSVWRYRVAEWALLILVLKLLSFSDKPLSYIWANLQAMWWNPLDAINIEFYMILVLGFLSWIVATDTIADFDKLSDPYTFRTTDIAPLNRIITRYFVGGLLLLLISGLSQVILLRGFSALADLRRPTIQGIIVNVLVYFMLGLVLLGQANLARLTTRWRIHKIEVNPNLAKQWARYGLFFLGIVTAIVFFLPTSYTMGFLKSAGIVVDTLIMVIVSIFQFIFLLLSLPFLLLSRLLGGEQDQMPDNVPAELSVAPPVSPPSPILWLEAIRSLIFWLVALAMLGYLIKTYLVDRPELLAALNRFRPINFAIRLWQQIWQSILGWAQTGFDIIAEQVRFPHPDRAGALSGRGRGWFGPGKMSARERILYYYLNILKRAERRKVMRRIGETPYEYEPNLEQAVPDVEADVQQVTDVFVRARYSRQGFNDDDAARVKERWERIRQALRRSR